MAELAWWRRGAIYQIYPRSFADSNGDDVGDCAGSPRALTTSPTFASSRSGCRRSPTSLFRRLAALPRELPALQDGSQRRLDAGPDVLAWVRDEQILAAVNCSGDRGRCRRVGACFSRAIRTARATGSGRTRR